LAKEGNNHFGIKCHNDWHGEKILHDDNKAQECFRKYNNPEESFKDHSKFLANRKRYAFLFRLPKTDYEAWARGLKKAGYATDPSYPDKLIYIINKYNLAKMDKDVLKQMSVKVNEDETHQKDKKKKFIYEVKEGETLFTIARKFNVPVKDIQRINNLNDFDIYQGQILVLTENEELETPASTVENKKNETSNYQNISGSGMNDTSNESITSSNKNDNPNNDLDLHIVKQGETLFLISKTYHVDIEKLRKINHLSGNEIRVGSVIKVPKQAKGNIRKDISEKEPSVKKSNTSTANETDAVYHVVQPGETLYRIHVNYHVSINKLRKLNHLKGNYIKVGQKLRIK
jgi:LysM repeat protein